jgi:hypothetical protein
MVAARSVPHAASDELDPHEARVLLRLALLKPRSLGAAGAAFQEH